MGTPVSILPSSPISSNTMKTVCAFLILACLTALVVSEPRFRKLEKKEQRLGCSILEISKCQKEVEKALEDCGHIDITDLDTVMTRVNDILAMTDCQKCICDILPIC